MRLPHEEDAYSEVVIQYAVNNLHVTDSARYLLGFPCPMLTEFIDAVVVCGHTQCGGVEARWLLAQSVPAVPKGTPLHRWLQPIVVTAKALGLNKLPYLEQKERALRILTSANAREQVSLGFLWPCGSDKREYRPDCWPTRI
jgi:hypothetical protein